MVLQRAKISHFVAVRTAELDAQIAIALENSSSIQQMVLLGEWLGANVMSIGAAVRHLCHHQKVCLCSFPCLRCCS
jgi:hypothetical protein